MLRALQLIRDGLDTPDAHGRDWWAWGAGQMAHALIGLMLAALLFAWLGHAWVAAAIGAAIYALAKELRDGLKQRTLRGWRDAIHDALFVAAGAVLAAALLLQDWRAFTAAAAAGATGLIIGVMQRAAAALRANP
jgi:small-conductance mechanosensitive channel